MSDAAGPGGAGDRVLRLAAMLVATGSHLVTAESCTGGLVAAACTAVAGSSAWLERGFVVYSNAAKVQSLGVAEALIAAHGAVSGEVAAAMAEGALARAEADVSVAITGIAGPGGGSEGKPVGTVWIAVAGGAKRAAGTRTEAPASAEAHRFVFGGDRAAVRAASVEKAFDLLLGRLS